jgi:hypothetical protein
MEAIPTPDRLAEATRLADATHLAEATAAGAPRLESRSGGTSTPDSRISDSWPPQALPPDTPIAVAELYTFLVSCGEF